MFTQPDEINPNRVGQNTLINYITQHLVMRFQDPVRAKCHIAKSPNHDITQ